MTETFLTAEVDWFPLVVFVLWIIGSIISSVRKKRGQQSDSEWEAPPTPQRTEQVDRGQRDRLTEVLREIERDLGLRTPEPPKPEPAKAGRVSMEDGERVSADVEAWHTAPSPIEAASRKTQALHRRQMITSMSSEERRDEIARKKAALEARHAAPARETPPGRPPLVASLMGDLTGGGGQLSKAVLLREILGPPVSMREGE